MPTIKGHLALRIVANFTAFLRFEAGLTRGLPPEGDDPARERKLRRRVNELREQKKELQSALTNRKWDPTEARRQLEKEKQRLAKLEATVASAPKRWLWTQYIVSDEHRFVYLFNPKVASTSILNALFPLFDLGPDVKVLKNFEEDAHLKNVHGLFRQSPYHINKATLLERMWNPYQHYFKFAFVRNPWDRLVSCYMSKVVQGGSGMKMRKYGGIRIRRDMTFEEFAKAVCQIPDEEANIHFRSQHVFVCDDGPEKHLLADFVGRFENLEEDFEFVAERIGLKTGLPHAGSSRSKNLHSYRTFYDENLARMVGERYREDVEIFGYSF